MSGKKRSTDTIAALLGSAPALAPVRDEPADGPSESSPQSPAVTPSVAPALRPAAPVHPSQLPPPPADDADYDDTDLESFELQADAPLVRPRRPSRRTTRRSASTGRRRKSCAPSGCWRARSTR